MEDALPELWTAILSGQYDLATQMIYRGANVNEPTKTYIDPATTLLHYAVFKKCDVRCIRVLANLGANVNALDSLNRTPLHYAAGTGVSLDAVEELINEGAVVDAQDTLQMTPLHHAARVNDINLAQKLITRGASINAISKDDWSVLHQAVLYHNLEIVKLLISHGVKNIDAKDNHGFTPLLYYFTNDRGQMEGEDKTEIIELLLDNGANVNGKSPDGLLFPLLLAADCNFLASIHILMKWGARINEATNVGDTALHSACIMGLADVTALLLKFGADLNARNEEGNTPFELLPDSPSSEATAQIIIREAVKREALGQSLCEGYKQMAQSCENYSKFDQECREEVKRMQSEKIDAENSAISFFYIFSMDQEKLAALARNEEIVTAFESSGYVATFRIYAGELTTNFEAAKNRAKFLMSVEDCLGDVLGDMLPAPIVQKIAVYR